MANATSEPLATSSLEQAREKTDMSLKSERLRTDEALVSDTHASESREDEILESSRNKTDRTQTRERASRDVVRDEQRDSDASPATGKHAEDALIERERAGADKAKHDERNAADAARLRERRRLRLTAEALLVLERGTTDADLSTERTHFDDEFGREESAHQETKASLSTRAEYMAIVSHDLRNPLASIAMGAEVLRAKLEAPELDLEGAIRFVSVIQRNTAMMDRLISDLLDVERIAAGKVEVHPSRQSIDALLSECEDLFASVAAKHGLTLKISAPADKLFAHFDHDRILQVLSNLIGNALKHTPRGGTVVLAARRCEGEVEMTVTDSGPGIPLPQQKRIFEKFSQLGVGTRQGLGLGLYISRWIVEAHSGTIAVASNPGEGSVFTFTVPASP